MDAKITDAYQVLMAIDLKSNLIRSVTQSVKNNKGRPITVTCNGLIFENIWGARRYTGQQGIGIESYTDLILETRNSSPINISTKGERPPNMDTDNIRALDVIVPGITTRFMNAFLNRLLEQNYEKGNSIPSLFAKVNIDYRKRLTIGTQALGGPIRYMYLGSGSFQFNEETGVMILDGTFLDPKEYAKNIELYITIQPAQEDQPFDPDEKQGGIPKIYGKSLSRSDSYTRVSLVNNVTDSSIVVEI